MLTRVSSAILDSMMLGFLLIGLFRVFSFFIGLFLFGEWCWSLSWSISPKIAVRLSTIFNHSWVIVPKHGVFVIRYLFAFCEKALNNFCCLLKKGIGYSMTS